MSYYIRIYGDNADEITRLYEATGDPFAGTDLIEEFIQWQQVADQYRQTYGQDSCRHRVFYKPSRSNNRRRIAKQYLSFRFDSEADAMLWKLANQ